MKEKARKTQELYETIKEALSKKSWDQINSNLLEKRLQWYEKYKNNLNLKGSDVRKAYTLLLIEYLKIPPGEVPIVHEEKNKIIWRSYNSCSVLEACKKGVFDTRIVCKNGWEQSTQLLISKINPCLVFSRNYEKIRPYAPYCEEGIELLIDNDFSNKKSSKTF
ncbi:MAG: hypothetical protein ACFE8U_15600 [Candidatus Hermodarchaeota archaeon]